MKTIRGIQRESKLLRHGVFTASSRGAIWPACLVDDGSGAGFDGAPFLGCARARGNSSSFSPCSGIGRNELEALKNDTCLISGARPLLAAATRRQRSGAGRACCKAVSERAVRAYERTQSSAKWLPRRLWRVDSAAGVARRWSAKLAVCIGSI